MTLVRTRQGPAAFHFNEVNFSPLPPSDTRTLEACSLGPGVPPACEEVAVPVQAVAQVRYLGEVKRLEE